MFRALGMFLALLSLFFFIKLSQLPKDSGVGPSLLGLQTEIAPIRCGSAARKWNFEIVGKKERENPNRSHVFILQVQDIYKKKERKEGRNKERKRKERKKL